MLNRVLALVALFAVASLASVDEPSKKSGYFQIGTDFNFGFNGGPTDPTFAVDTVEKYGGNWRGLRIPLETARNYEERIEPFFTLSFKAGYKDFHFLLEAPLRKDLEAWYNSELKTNLTYKPSELDINVPINAYAKWYNPVGFVQFGRFNPEGLKVSKNDILIGGLPYHDGIHWNLNLGIFRYDFLLSSLNAWLFGDDVNLETGCPYDENSEAYAQKCRTGLVSNQRNRIYTENVKNLVFHRIGIETRKFWIYVVEESVIGGKSLEFRSINPFMFGTITMRRDIRRRQLRANLATRQVTVLSSILKSTWKILQARLVKIKRWARTARLSITWWDISTSSKPAIMVSSPGVWMS